MPGCSRARSPPRGCARVYDLQTSGRSDWIFRMIGPGPRPEWVGRVAGASHRHDDPRRDFLHTQERLAGQLARAGVVPQAAPDLSWMDGDVARFGLPARVALLVPGAYWLNGPGQNLFGQFNDNSYAYLQLRRAF